MRVNENILISSLTTMRLGGPARYVLEVETPAEVADAYGFAAQFGLPIFVLGWASALERVRGRGIRPGPVTYYNQGYGW